MPIIVIVHGFPCLVCDALTEHVYCNDDKLRCLKCRAEGRETEVDCAALEDTDCQLGSFNWN
ncbi:hypothetical protein ES708_17916 [subsurface metagenome]